MEGLPGRFPFRRRPYRRVWLKSARLLQLSCLPVAQGEPSCTSEQTVIPRISQRLSSLSGSNTFEPSGAGSSRGVTWGDIELGLGDFGVLCCTGVMHSLSGLGAPLLGRQWGSTLPKGLSSPRHLFCCPGLS